MSADRGRLPWGRIYAIAVAQTISWGTVYYSFTLFLGPMQADLNWSKADLSAGISIALAVAAIASLGTGRWIDRFGGRVLMTGGSLVAATLLATWSSVAQLQLYYAIWAAFGLVLATTLYDPAFMVLVTSLKERAPKAIMAVTLVAGFAGTIFVPLTNVLIDSLGWREALMVLAGFNLLICVPIHWLALKGLHHRQRDAVQTPPEPGLRSPVAAAMRRPVFWAILFTFICHAVFYSSVPVHFIPLLIDSAMEKDAAVAIFALIGPSQVAGRVLLATASQWIALRYAGLAAFFLSFSGFAVLALAPQSVTAILVFAIFYGAANGMTTIVRATIVPELLGHRGIGAIQGTIAFPVSMLLAGAPYFASLLEQRSGSYGPVVVMWLMLAGAALCGFAVALWLGRGEKRGGELTQD
jgi:predicted MFS family arabinose efflux permease